MRPFRTLAIASAVAVAWAAPAGAATKPRVSWVKCQDRCAAGKVQRDGTVKLAGRGFTNGSRVVFSVKRDGKRAKRTMGAKRLSSRRLTVRVPGNALSGRIYVRARGGARSNSAGPVRVMPAQKDNAPSTP